MKQNYPIEFKKKTVRLREEAGRTYPSLAEKYGVSKTSINNWCREYSRECWEKAEEKPGEPNEMEVMKENRRLRQEQEEAQKEIAFLKKQRHSLRGKSVRGYRFIDENREEFRTRWLLRRLKIYPNAYYNYRKGRKQAYYAGEKEVKKQIEEIYHEHMGVDGYRRMAVYLA